MKPQIVVSLISFISLFSTVVYAEVSHESSVGIVSTTGNTEMETYNVKTATKYINGDWDYALSGHYTLGTQIDSATDEKVESARNWDVSARIGRKIYKNLSGFIAHKIEGDEFAGFIERNNTDLGITYTFYRTDTTYLFSDLGYRRQVTNPVEGEAYDSNKGRLYVETQKKINPNFSYKFWVEYLPDFAADDENGNQANFEPSIAATLTDIFSLQVAYKGMYNSAPVGDATEYYDSVFTTSLLAKF